MRKYLSALTLVLATMAFGYTPASAEPGVLSCHKAPGGSWGTILIHSKYEYDCTFTEQNGATTPYKATAGTLIGVDMAFRADDHMEYVVSGLGDPSGSATLEGLYLGGTWTLRASAGPQMQVGLLGVGSDVKLMPFGFGYGEGWGLAAGMGYLAVERVGGPAPRIVKTFIVYFDFDSADINAGADKVLNEIEAAVKSMSPNQILLSGHTDTSGNSAYNRRLSIRRSQAVAKALASRGIKSRVMDMQHYGESKLMVPTADGVKEAGNRRVEVYFEK